MYLALEGIDTAGKSTQIERLRQCHLDAIITKEPGGTPAGQMIRSLIIDQGVHHELTELFLFLADRSEHVAQVVIPNEGKLVISDRSIVSGMAYAMDKQPLAIDELIRLHRIATQNTLPDHVIILRLDEYELVRRLNNKHHDRIESRGVDYLMQIQTDLQIAVEMLHLNHTVIDASMSKNSITEQINSIISKGVL